MECSRNTTEKVFISTEKLLFFECFKGYSHFWNTIGVVSLFSFKNTNSCPNCILLFFTLYKPIQFKDMVVLVVIVMVAILLSLAISSSFIIPISS